MFEEDTQKASLDAVLKKPKKPSPGKSGSSAKRLNAEKKDSEFQNIMKRDSYAFDLNRSNGTDRGRAYVPLYKKRKFWWTIVTLIALCAIFLLGARVVGWAQKIFEGSSPLSFFSSFGNLITDNETPLEGEATGTVNILLLGIGGGGHEGGTLTDTIMLASIKLGQDKDAPAEVALLSIPRDFIVRLPEGLEFRKINSAYAYGELRGEGVGAQWARDAVSDWVGEEIPYYAVLDFAGFTQLVDDLGGIDVDIENSFSDSFYPDSQFGYLPTIRFEKGVEHMDGERALQFVRSRHGTNGEGGDFARARRQQQVLAAIKTRAGELRISTNLGTITKLLDTFADNFKTNLEPWELKRVYDLIQDTPQSNIFSLALDYSTGLICDEIVEETNAAVLTICPQVTKQDVRNFARERFDYARLQKESPITVEFQNSTKTNFLAQRAAQALSAYYTKSTTANFPGEIQPRTVIYDLTAGTKPLTLSRLKTELASEARTDYPFLEDLSDPRPDFIIVLGQDASEKFPL